MVAAFSASISSALEGGAISTTQMNLEQKLGAELIEAENAATIADNQLRTLQSKTVGESAVREARARVRAFMATGRENVDEREAFNQWFHSTGLVVLVDPSTKTCELGVARIKGTEITEVWLSEWILPHLHGEDRERYLQDVAKLQAK